VSEGSSPQPAALLIATISVDERWLKTSNALSTAVSEQAGIDAAAAREIGAGVEAVVTAILEQGRAGPPPRGGAAHPRELRITFEPAPQTLSIAIECAHGPAARQLGEALARDGSTAATNPVVAEAAIADTPGGGVVCRFVRPRPG
jgi:hypothetical protein